MEKHMIGALIVFALALFAVILYGVYRCADTNGWCNAECSAIGGTKLRYSAGVGVADSCLCVMPDHTIRAFTRE